jgi:hypothetical protein
MRHRCACLSPNVVLPFVRSETSPDLEGDAMRTAVRSPGQASCAGESPVPRLTELEAAAARLYDAEVALHCARQTQVDAWVAAAYDRLHEAVEAHLRVWSTTSLAS